MIYTTESIYSRACASVFSLFENVFNLNQDKFQFSLASCGIQMLSIWTCLKILSFRRELLEKKLLRYQEQFIVPRFLAPLAVGQRAYVMVRCPSCVRPSVNFFFKHLL